VKKEGKNHILFLFFIIAFGMVGFVNDIKLFGLFSILLMGFHLIYTKNSNTNPFKKSTYMESEK